MHAQFMIFSARVYIESAFSPGALIRVPNPGPPGRPQGPVCPAECLLMGLKEDSPPWPCSRGRDVEHPTGNTFSPECYSWAPFPPSTAHARYGQSAWSYNSPGKPPGGEDCLLPRERNGGSERGSDLSRVPQCISEGEGEQNRPFFRVGA